MTGQRSPEEYRRRSPDTARARRNAGCPSLASAQLRRRASPQPAPFPLDDLTHDLITILHEKSKGLEPFDHYLEDARDDPDLRLTLEDIREQDERAMTELRDHPMGLIMLPRDGSVKPASGFGRKPQQKGSRAKSPPSLFVSPCALSLEPF